MFESGVLVQTILIIKGTMSPIISSSSKGKWVPFRNKISESPLRMEERGSSLSNM